MGQAGKSSGNNGNGNTAKPQVDQARGMKTEVKIIKKTDKLNTQLPQGSYTNLIIWILDVLDTKTIHLHQTIAKTTETESAVGKKKFFKNKSSNIDISDQSNNNKIIGQHNRHLQKVELGKYTKTTNINLYVSCIVSMVNQYGLKEMLATLPLCMVPLAPWLSSVCHINDARRVTETFTGK